MYKPCSNEILFNTVCRPAPAPKMAAMLNHSVGVTVESRVCDTPNQPLSPAQKFAPHAVKGLARVIMYHCSR
jgi:hypothetical protein